MLSLRVMRLFAASDARLFEHHLQQAGLTIVGRRDTDSLRNKLQAESVLSIAATITSDANDHLELTQYQRQLRSIAEEAGYLVGLTEGLDQQPGSWPNPVRTMLNGDEEEDEEPEVPAGGPPGAEGAPPPPDGGAPPPPGGEGPPPA